jgi:hypothetical protein
VRVPVLWFVSDVGSAGGIAPLQPAAYEKIANRKMLVWLNPSGDFSKQVAGALTRWLDDLPNH